jgi:Domain of unknown function (DUF4145)
VAAMKCPHCLEGFHDTWNHSDFGTDADGNWRQLWTTCPACKRYTVKLFTHGGEIGTVTRVVYPKGISRSPLSPDVPDKFAEDYREACLVFADSPKASAALSRRCLQLIIREHVGIKKRTLADEIDALLELKTLPSHLADALDGVRHIGNFAAHPEKSTNTGEIVAVEPGEAEWLLDTLEGLFDFYFVGPAVLQKKKDALNQKLMDAGKKPMK